MNRHKAMIKDKSISLSNMRTVFTMRINNNSFSSFII